ncbi:MAG: hypothetical protein BM557_01405 [Flavobacterium sp. MedPE-SWcel]|uniref:hypothetical protein n=1 Tax=uncultured Flavobacterium sp. TaxID=165435 RepID=UPI00091D47BA|nr:hypothetical protein [uncultured Flavobacterium sp.]OIQ22063.1 MAG: hypothetical protein BM557_01405 [Flavobacterium sp. MedPE-SWcel]
MRKFIHSSFEIDLSVYEITDTAENPWFTENYFAKYSYPFEIPLTDKYNNAMGFIDTINSKSNETLFEGVYVHDNVMEKAILEIEEYEQALSVTLRYGLEDFPNFKKKLSELQLIRMPVDNIYEHAAGVIAQTWPAVNYNFPQIHTDKIEPEDNDTWFAFEKIINNYKNGAFLINEVDTVEEITYNRNIIQPVPYLLYLLQAGVADAGYTLHGDILQDETLQKTLVYSDNEYYSNISQESTAFQMLAKDYDTMSSLEPPYIYMDRNFPIPQPGRYRITGTVRLRRVIVGAPTRFKVYYRETLVYETSFSFWQDFITFIDFDLDITIDTIADGNPDYLQFSFDTGYNEDDVLLAVDINPVFLYNDTGAAVPSILNPNNIELNRAVPDMLFGDLFKTILTLKRMSIDIKDKQVWVNFISNEMATKPIIDLSAFEIKFPKRTFSRGSSFLLKYEDPGSEDYLYAEVFQDTAGAVTTGFTKDDKTTETVLKALPLPLLHRNNVQTAYAFSSDNAKPLFVLYDGVTAGVNSSKDPAPLLLPSLHQQHHYSWYAARIKGQAVSWQFLAHTEQLQGLTAKSRIHAYSTIHLVKSLQKTQVSPDLFEVEIETEII